MPRMTSIAEYLANQLSLAGIRTAYGLPGGENIEILEALRKRGIDFVLVRNESSACFMAAASTRLTGIPSLAITTLGPGATNACAGFAHAYLDRAPILLITAASDPSLAGRHSHQALDLQALFRPISKFTAEITAANAVATIQRALQALTAGRPGPAHLSIHNDVALQAVGASPVPCQALFASNPAKNLSQAAIKRSAALLADKERPVILAGLGLEPQQPYRQLRQLAEKLGAPLIDSPKSKGALSADHPLFVGTLGLTAHDPAYQFLHEADCIIAVGFDVVELVKPWQQTQPLIWIANWANDDPRINSEIEIVAPIGSALAALSGGDYHKRENWGAARVEKYRREQIFSHAQPRCQCVLPQAFLAALREQCPDDIIITTDVGSHKIFTALHWQARLPNCYLVSNGLSAMGYGLCSAIAAARVSRRPVVCITGDGGLAMVMGELGLLAELQLPVIVAVMNDSALDLIRSAQTRRARQTFGTEFRNPDFALIAAGFGIAYRRAENQADCVEAIEYGLASGKPLLLDVMIDPTGYQTTPTSPAAAMSPALPSNVKIPSCGQM